MSDLDKINSLFNAKIDSVKSKEQLQNIKTEFFGKNGQNYRFLRPEMIWIFHIWVVFDLYQYHQF